MSDYPHSTSGDADYWQLTNPQRWHHHGRISDYHMRMVHSHADRVSELAHVAVSYFLVSLFAALFLLGLVAVAWWMR